MGATAGHRVRVRRRYRGDGMAHSKAEQLKVARRRAEVLRLYLAGKPQYEIAALLGVQAMTISRDIAAVKREWQASAVRDLDAHKGEILEKLDLIQRECWESWHASKADRSTAKAGKRYAADGARRTLTGEWQEHQAARR